MVKLVGGASKFDSNNNDWETTGTLFDLLNLEFHFTIDLAASEHNKKVGTYFSKIDNALEQEWRGVCWCNPPFGEKSGNQLKNFVKKGFEDYKKYGSTIVMLLPARTNTNWWNNYCNNATEIRFIRGRPPFKGCNFGLMQPLAIVIFSPHADKTIVKSQEWK